MFFLRKVIYLSIFVLTATSLVAVAQSPVWTDRIRLIDAADLLAESFKINRKPRPMTDAACDGGGKGMRSKKYCNYVREVRDIKIEKVISISVGQVDIEAIPVVYDKRRIGINNEWSEPYSFKRTSRYTSKQYVQVVLTDQLTKVSEFSTSVEFDAKLFDSIGVRAGQSSKKTVTIDLTKQETKTHEEEFTLDEPIEFQVPPCVGRFAEYFDQKRRVSLPLVVRGLLTAKVYDVVPGWKREFFIQDIGPGDPQHLREFTLRGNVEMQGSDRQLTIELRESKLDPSSCAKK